jgi:hypothetical protein
MFQLPSLCFLRSKLNGPWQTILKGKVQENAHTAPHAQLNGSLLTYPGNRSVRIRPKRAREEGGAPPPSLPLIFRSQVA